MMMMMMRFLSVSEEAWESLGNLCVKVVDTDVCGTMGADGSDRQTERSQVGISSYYKLLQVIYSLYQYYFNIR